jgi:hypothetical protein
MLHTLSDFLKAIQLKLFPHLEEALTPLQESHRKCITTLELVKIEKFIPFSNNTKGRRPFCRRKIARAFVIKAVLNIVETNHLRERIICDPTLRRICGWDSICEIPSESVFCRAFAEFSEINLPERVHEAFVKQVYEQSTVIHLSRDSTDIPARERPQKKIKKEDSKENEKRGLKSKQDGKCEKQKTQCLEEIMSEISIQCDFGSKKSSKGHRYSWIGYKLHVDVTDESIPISCKLTSASVHDSLLAIPLSTISSQRIRALYEIMDKGYYVDAISTFIEERGRKALIVKCPKTTKAKEDHEQEALAKKTLNWQPAEEIRFKHRTAVERFNSNLKDNFGGRTIRVKGHQKIFCHLMFSVLALSAFYAIRLNC